MTPSPPDALLAKTARGAGWMIGWRAATRLLGVASTLILVRLLAPADFGLVALAAGFAQAIDSFSVLGVEEALLREAAPTPVLYDTGFTLNVLRALATAVVVAALAVPAAAFFAEPRLAAILLVLAGAALLDGFGNIGMVEFRRSFAFDREFRLFILPRLGSILLVIAAALLLRSYWALVLGIIVQRLLRVALSYRMHPYRPRFGLGAWRRLVFYSAWTWVLGVAELIRDRSDTLLIGRLIDPTGVGLYSIGAEVAQLPTTELVEPIGRTAFSTFTAARHGGDGTHGNGVGPTYLRLLAGMAMLTLPAGIGLSAVADPLVTLAFGANWAASVPLVRVLGLAGGLTGFGVISSVLLSAHGMLPVLVRITMLAMALRVALLIGLLRAYGLFGGGLAAALAIGFEQAVLVVTAFRRFGLRPRALLRAVWRSLLASAAMAAALWAAGLGWQTVPGEGMALAMPLLAAVAGGVVVYAGVLLGSWLAAGRPDGAEADTLQVLRGAWRRLVGIGR